MKVHVKWSILSTPTAGTSGVSGKSTQVHQHQVQQDLLCYNQVNQLVVKVVVLH